MFAPENAIVAAYVRHVKAKRGYTAIIAKKAKKIRGGLSQ
jgi:hypothetical protein